MSEQCTDQQCPRKGHNIAVSTEVQYRECYEYWRQVLRFIWQVPAVAVVVDGALVVSTFALLTDWLVREFVLAIAVVLTAVLIFALFKFRHFSTIGQETLTEIEKLHAVKVIQRTSGAKNHSYWFKKEASGFSKMSSDRVLIVGMFVILALLIALMAVNATMLNTCPPAKVLPTSPGG